MTWVTDVRGPPSVRGQATVGHAAVRAVLNAVALLILKDHESQTTKRIPAPDRASARRCGHICGGELR
jgi:hypothetical protein